MNDSPPELRASIGRDVLEMAITSALSLLALFLTDILTLTYVSRLHDEAMLAAVGVAKTLMFINSIVVTGIVVAGGRVITRRVEAGGTRLVPALAAQLLVVAVGVSGAVALVEWRFLDPIVGWLGDASASGGGTRPFLWLMLASSVAMALTQACAQLLRALGDSRRALAVLLVAAGTLAVLDPLLILGLDLALPGAGTAGLLAAAAGGAAGLWVVKRRVGLVMRLHLKRHRRAMAGFARRIVRISLPYTLGNLAMPLAITFMLGQLAAFGVSAMAGMALMDRVLQVAYCLYFALPSALVPVFSRHLLGDDPGPGRASVMAAVRLVVVHGLVVWAVLLVAAPALAEAFALSAPARALFETLCRVGAGAWLVIGLDFIAVSVFITLDRAWWITLFSWLRASVGTVPFVLAGAERFGASGVVLGMWGGHALVALASIATATLLVRRARPARPTVADTGAGASPDARSLS